MADVILKCITKSFGAVDVLKGVDLSVEHGEFVLFVGPSGCGKSTLLRLIAGLETVSSGEVQIAEVDVTHIPPARRGVAMVFQSYALFPHMTVAENISFGLRLARRPQSEIEQHVRKVAETLQITPLLDRHPKQLSGGQRQRVAIGRAIIRNPKVFLFDEPLSNLDAALRNQMRIEIARLHADLGATMIYVTHDQVEAMTLADRIVVMNGGVIEQIGTPMELYSRPRNLFVAGFIGSPKMNFLHGTIVGGEKHFAIDINGCHFPLPADVSVTPSQKVIVGLRPEDVTLAKEGAYAVCLATPVVREHLGSETLVYYRSPASSELLIVKSAGLQDPAKEQTTLFAHEESVHLFREDGERIC
jgi:ABC-type sugar transport system ATPase subunit